MLLAAYRDWKMLRALSLTTSGDAWSFDALFGRDRTGSQRVAVHHARRRRDRGRRDDPHRQAGAERSSAGPDLPCAWHEDRHPGAGSWSKRSAPVIASGRSTVSDDGSWPPSPRSGRCRCRPATRSFTWSARTGASACDGWSGHQTLVIHPALNAPTHDRLGFWVTRRVFGPHRCEESCANLRRKQVLIGMVRARMVGT